MLLPEQIQVRLADLADALRDARDNPPPAPTAPAPPLDDQTLQALTKQNEDLAKQVVARSDALAQRADEQARAQKQLREVYDDALSRISALVPKGEGKPREPGPVIKR